MSIRLFYCIHSAFITNPPGVCHDAECPSAGLGPAGEFWPLSPALSRSHGGPYHPVLLLRKRGVRACVRGTAGVNYGSDFEGSRENAVDWRW